MILELKMNQTKNAGNSRSLLARMGLVAKAQPAYVLA